MIERFASTGARAGFAFALAAAAGACAVEASQTGAEQTAATQAEALTPGCPVGAQCPPALPSTIPGTEIWMDALGHSSATSPDANYGRYVGYTVQVDVAIQKQCWLTFMGVCRLWREETVFPPTTITATVNPVFPSNLSCQDMVSKTWAWEHVEGWDSTAQLWVDLDPSDQPVSVGGTGSCAAGTTRFPHAASASESSISLTNYKGTGHNLTALRITALGLFEGANGWQVVPVDVVTSAPSVIALSY